MGLFDKFAGKPKEMTDDQKRERYMMSRYQLVKDPNEPFTYFLNDRSRIRFNPADPESVANAEKAILEFYKNPTIETVTKDEQMVRAGAKSKGQKAGPNEWHELGQFGENMQTASEHFFGGVGVPDDYDPLALPKDMVNPKTPKKRPSRNRSSRSKNQ